MPTHKYEEGAWIHPARLPLGGGWKGYCTAPGHEGEIPGEDRLREHCNLGYVTCPNCPPDRIWDSVRFSVIREREKNFTLCYVCERNHHPGEHGSLEYDAAIGSWLSEHPDPRIQKMAECYLGSYLDRKRGSDSGVS